MDITNMESPKCVQKVPNLPMNHVALSCTYIEVVVDWYSRVLGFRLLNGIQHIKRSEQPDSNNFKIYGQDLHEVKLAWMSTGNGVGFEIFEFFRPRSEPVTESFAYHKQGFFHICVTHPDPNTLVREIQREGGKQFGETVDPLNRGMQCTYVADPWGNVIEILNVTFDQQACMPPLAKPVARSQL